MEGIKIEGTLLTLLNEKAQKSSDNRWMGLYQCECGNQKLIRNKDVKAGKTKSCGCLKTRNSKKIKEGENVPDSYLTLIKEKAEQRNGYWYGLYQCSCGTQKIISNADVRNGKIKSCGCYKKEKLSEMYSYDLTGQKFGRWTVLNKIQEKTGRGSIWLCECECGTRKEIQYNNLILGKTKSCGCLRQELFSDDITNQRFGKLIAIKPNWDITNQKKQGTVFWDCKCDCGNTVTVAHHALKQLQKISCGCLISKGEHKIKMILELLQIPYESQKQFPDLIGINKGKLRCDFYLPTYNIVIEYQGIQHYEIVNQWGGEEGLKLRQANDELKRIYCKNNNIILIEISYKDFNLLNEQYIKKCLNIGEEA